jgi:predicted transcriptional regulator
MAVGKRHSVKVSDADYRLLKQLAKDRRQDLLVVLGEAITEFGKRHRRKRASPTR